jgi:hypothetical protein
VRVQGRQRLICKVILSFKGLCHEMNICLEGLKNQIFTFCIGADSFFNFFVPLLWKN